MKIKAILTVTVLSAMLASCSFFKQKKADKEPVFAMIDSAQLFNRNVLDTFWATQEANTYARKLFLNAVDLSVNKKNPGASLSIFVKSLRINPDGDTYLKYGDALLALGNNKIAEEAYQTAMHVGDAYKAEAYYGLAKCSVADSNVEDAMYWLAEAFETFPFDKERIDNDKGFDPIRENEKFKIVLAKYLSISDEDKKARLLALFEKGFEKKLLPFNISVDSVSIGNGNSIDYRYSDLIEDLNDGEFSREVSYDFQYVAKLDFSPDFKAFVYRKVDVVSDTLNPVHTFLVTMDTVGTVISQQEISCYCSPLTLKTCTIDEKGNVEVKEIVQTWKEDPIYKGYEGNEVLKQEIKGISYFTVDEEGNINSVETANDPTKAPEVVNVTTR